MTTIESKSSQALEVNLNGKSRHVNETNLRDAISRFRTALQTACPGRTYTAEERRVLLHSILWQPNYGYRTADYEGQLDVLVKGGHPDKTTFTLDDILTSLADFCGALTRSSVLDTIVSRLLVRASQFKSNVSTSILGQSFYRGASTSVFVSLFGVSYYPPLKYPPCFIQQSTTLSCFHRCIITNFICLPGVSPFLLLTFIAISCPNS